MASLKDVKYKVVAIQKTKQITRAMNMVSSAKLRSAQRKVENFRPYQKKYFDMVTEILQQERTFKHDLLESRGDSNTVCLLFITPDRGLCGGFATGLIQRIKAVVKEIEESGKAVTVYCIGRKGYEAVKKIGATILGHKIGCMSSIDFAFATELSLELQEYFLAGKFEEIHLVYGHFVSLMEQETAIEQLLPIAIPVPDVLESTDTIYEPNKQELLDELIPSLVRICVFGALVDTIVSEHAARMIAMNSATNNCNDLIQSLSRLYNKARQAAVTRDLMDIVGGAEALNG